VGFINSFPRATAATVERGKMILVAHFLYKNDAKYVNKVDTLEVEVVG